MLLLESNIEDYDNWNNVMILIKNQTQLDGFESKEIREINGKLYILTTIKSYNQTINSTTRNTNSVSDLTGGFQVVTRDFTLSFFLNKGQSLI